MEAVPLSVPTVALPKAIIPPHIPRVVRSLAAPPTVDTYVPAATSAAVRSSNSVVNTIGSAAVPAASILPPLATTRAEASTGLLL